MKSICIVLFANAICTHAVGQEMRILRHVAYARPAGSARRFTTLDIYSPKTGSDRPVVVWIHGGAWKIGDKRGVQTKPEAFTKQGFVFISINYRLVPAVDYKAQAGDVARAIKYVHDNVRKVGGSPQRIFVMGHSAGAHLAALVATDDRHLKAAGLPLSTVKGVVLVDGACYDIPKQIAAARFIGKRIYEDAFGTDKAQQTDASPITHVARNKGIPPFLILHVADRDGSRIQSELLAKALSSAGVSAKVFAAQGKTHATINREMGQEGDGPTKEVFDFLRDWGKGSRFEASPDT